MLTEVLIAVTTEEIESVAKEVFAKQRQKAAKGSNAASLSSSSSLRRRRVAHSNNIAHFTLDVLSSFKRLYVLTWKQCNSSEATCSSQSRDTLGHSYLSDNIRIGNKILGKRK